MIAAEFARGRSELSRFVGHRHRIRVDRYGFGLVRDERAATTLVDLQVEWARCSSTGKPLRVISSGGGQKLLAPPTHACFQFWQAHTRVDLDEGFEPFGEVRVAQAMLAQLEAARFAVRSIAWRMLLGITVGEQECHRQTGRYPTDQQAFIADYLRHGLPAAIRRFETGDRDVPNRSKRPICRLDDRATRGRE